MCNYESTYYDTIDGIGIEATIDTEEYSDATPHATAPAVPLLEVVTAAPCIRALMRCDSMLRVIIRTLLLVGYLSWCGAAV